jgi:hypothetical protein
VNTVTDTSKQKIFISYRRDGGEYLSRYINEKLIKRGYNVFYDRESIVTGKFNVQLYDNIAKSDLVLVILPQNALDRCQNCGDWFRLEIAHAISLEKCIIPIMMEGFHFTDGLPEDIASLASYQAMRWSMDYWDASLSRLIKMIKQAKPLAVSNPDYTASPTDLTTKINKNIAEDVCIKSDDSVELTDNMPINDNIEEPSHNNQIQEELQDSDKKHKESVAAGTVAATATIAAAAFPAFGIAAGACVGARAIYHAFKKRKEKKQKENADIKVEVAQDSIEKSESD